MTGDIGLAAALNEGFQAALLVATGIVLAAVAGTAMLARSAPPGGSAATPGPPRSPRPSTSDKPTIEAVGGAPYGVVVQRGRLADLSEILARASALVDDLGSAPQALEVADRPSLLVAQPDNDPQPIIDRLASAQRLTFVVGAGASMEAGLPSWARLVRALLESVAPATLGESDRAAWLDAAAEAGLLGMAATARALAGSDEEFVKRVDRFLYRGKGPEQFDPGPLAREIAAWKRDYPEIRLATFNYDQLLERALEDVGIDAQARQDNDPEEDGVAAVPTCTAG